MNAMSLAILWPTVALAGLTFVVWSILLRKRFAHIAANRPTAADFANAEAVGRYFRPVERPAQNLANLFEMPVLYFVLVPLLILTGSGSAAQVVLAWVFVALRLAHTVIHIGPNTVRTRARVYIASSIVLFAMWVGFVIDLLAITGAGA
ncbi:membrane protein [Novosphingobium colocasiae]|uniref:Membrane protein n=2 Tax=Novosphingobium colocasiae TaxID=1256513 RepID=A0A918PG87_9SPHN|nr:membrane protein [Novosphingobium colocasiae]